MNQTTTAILQEIAQTGHAVICNHRNRDLHAALDLISAGICYRATTNAQGFFTIKFGSQPVSLHNDLYAKSIANPTHNA